MSADVPDERLERVVRRAVRRELELLAERLFWTFVAVLGVFWGLFLVASGINTRGGLSFAIAVFGAAMVVAAVRTLLLKWGLPPYGPTPE